MPSVMIVARDEAIGALMASLTELAGYQPVFPAADESVPRAIARLTPSILLLDCDDDAADHQEAYARARQWGTRVVLFNPSRTEREVRAVAADHGCAGFRMFAGGTEGGTGRRFIEVVKPERIVFQHLEPMPVSLGPRLPNTLRNLGRQTCLGTRQAQTIRLALLSMTNDYGLTIVTSFAKHIPIMRTSQQRHGANADHQATDTGLARENPVGQSDARQPGRIDPRRGLRLFGALWVAQYRTLPEIYE
jgi:CheY-like chemotaxis protein